MGTLRPYGYPGGTVYNTCCNGSNKNKAIAMFYGTSYMRCGWGALFYNNTGKNIKLTKFHALVGSKTSGCRVNFSCNVLGTSAAESFTANTTDASGVYTATGSTIGSWTSTSNTGNIVVNNGQYFVVGVYCTVLSSGYFNMARTGTSSSTAYRNCYYMEKSSNNSGKFVRSESNNGWRYQTPEIYVEWTENENPTYINGKRSESASFYQGDTYTAALSGYASPSISKSPSSSGINASKSGNNLNVTRTPRSTDESATITVSGINANSTLSITAKAPKYNSLNVSKNTLRPGESLTISETHTGSSNITYNNFSDNSSYTNISGNTVSVPSQNTSSFSSGTNVTVTAQAKYSGSNISGVNRTTTFKLNHWSTNDILATFSGFRLIGGSSSRGTITITNDSNFLGNSRLNISIPSSLSGKVSLNKSYIDKGESCTLSYVGSGETSATTFNVTLQIDIDKGITRTFSVSLTPEIKFGIIYPVNKTTPTGLLNLMPLPIFINSDGEFKLYNYPLRIQLPTAKNGDPTHTFNISVVTGVGNTEINSLVCSIVGNESSTTPGVFLAEDDSTDLEQEQYKTLMMNCYELFKLTQTGSSLLNLGYSSYSPSGTTVGIMCKITLKLEEFDANGNIVSHTNPNDYEIVLTFNHILFNDFGNLDNDLPGEQLVYGSNWKNSNNEVDKMFCIVNFAKCLCFNYGRYDNCDLEYFNGKNIYETQETIQNLLSGISSIVNAIKDNSASDSKDKILDCRPRLFTDSDSDIKNNLGNNKFIPYIMWDDSKPTTYQGETNLFLTAKDNNNEFYKSYGTISPMRELYRTIASFNSSILLNKLIYNDTESGQQYTLYSTDIDGVPIPLGYNIF